MTSLVVETDPACGRLEHTIRMPDHGHVLRSRLLLFKQGSVPVFWSQLETRTDSAILTIPSLCGLCLSYEYSFTFNSLQTACKVVALGGIEKSKPGKRETYGNWHPPKYLTVEK